MICYFCWPVQSASQAVLFYIGLSSFIKYWFLFAGQKITPTLFVVFAAAGCSGKMKYHSTQVFAFSYIGLLVTMWDVNSV